MSMPLWFLIFVLILYAKHDIQSLCDRYFRSLVSSSKRESEREKLEESTVSPARRSSFIFMKFSKKIQRQDEEESSIELRIARAVSIGKEQLWKPQSSIRIN